MPSLMGDFWLLLFTVLVGCQDPWPGNHGPMAWESQTCWVPLVGTFEIKDHMSQSSLSGKEQKLHLYFLKLKGSLM